MIRSLRFTVLMEHRSIQKGLATEHGLSLWLELDGIRILFDTGQSPAFAENAQKLGIDLSEADFIVLSHGHYDHTGGLEAALEAAPKARVCFHPEAGVTRYSHHPGQAMHALGMPESAWNALKKRLPQACLSSGPLKLAPGIWASGPIPRLHPVEHPQQAFSLDEAHLEPDPFRDDQALVLESKAGNVVITGCCHSGVANTLARAKAITRDERCVLLMGGLHLVRSSRAQIRRVGQTLTHASIQKLWSGHCTGEDAEALLGSLCLGDTPMLCGLLEVGRSWAVDLDSLGKSEDREVNA